jgi:cytochrome P450
MTTALPVFVPTPGEAAVADEFLRAALSTHKDDPYPWYRRLRETAPLYRSGLDGLWYASRYDDCRALLVDPRAGRRRDGVARRFGMSEVQAERFNRRQRSTMLLQNPPEHTRLRGQVSRAFTPNAVARLSDRIAELARPMVERMAEAGEVDVMADLAFPLPVTVIGELVGVPPDEREPFREHVRNSQASGEAGASPETIEAGERADEFMVAYFHDLVARRRAERSDDLLSELVAIHDSGGPLSEEELVSTAILLFVAGFVTTTNLIGNGLLALFRHPEEMERLWEQPELVASAVEEMLRWDSPVQLNGRTAFEDIDMAGVTIPAGETVITVIGGANRDPARFPEPERFDVARVDNAPLSFGWGIHHCLGAPLARLEGQVVFGLMVERFAHLELVDEHPPRAASAILRGLDSLPVRVKPR